MLLHVFCVDFQFLFSITLILTKLNGHVVLLRTDLGLSCKWYFSCKSMLSFLRKKIPLLSFFSPLSVCVPLRNKLEMYSSGI